MRNKYSETMDKLKVTEDMRQRILQNISKMDSRQNPPSTLLSRGKRLLPIAACFAALLFGAVLANGSRDRPSEPDVPLIDHAQGIEECASKEALTEAVGFSVEGISALPFEADTVTYTAYWNELAQIEYCGKGGQTALYRKSIGTEDNSGVYDTFDMVDQIDIGGVTVTLKGTGGQYVLALWNDGAYTCSVYLSEGMTQAVWENMLSGSGWSK